MCFKLYTEIGYMGMYRIYGSYSQRWPKRACYVSKPVTCSQPSAACVFLHERDFFPHSTLLAVQVLTATTESLISCHGYTIFSPASTGLRDV